MALTSDEQWNIEAQVHQHAMQHFSHSTHHHHHHHAVSKSSFSSSSSSSKSRSVACNCKPVITKRRCRASKKSPVILLNANSSNFRALVQQFTGCPTTPLSPGVPFKGPITLNFQRGIREMQIHHNNRSSATTRPTSYQDDHHNNNNQVLHHVRRLHQNHQQHKQLQSQASADLSDDFDDGLHDQEQKINVDDNDYCMIMEKDCSFGVCLSSSSGLREVSDDLTDDHFDGLMDDFSLHDLIDMNNAFSNDLGYFL